MTCWNGALCREGPSYPAGHQVTTSQQCALVGTLKRAKKSQQGKGGSPSPLLCPSESTSGVLGFLVQER